MANKPEDTCAFKMCCKGVCNTPSSCRKASMTTEDYWKEIQISIKAKGRLERINHYINTTDPKNIKIDIIKKWSEG